MTPILGAGLKFYPRDKIVIDATSSIKFRSDFDTTNLYHYEIGGRVYITPQIESKGWIWQIVLRQSKTFRYHADWAWDIPSKLPYPQLAKTCCTRFSHSSQVA